MTKEKFLSIRVAPSVLKSALDLAELELETRRDAGAVTNDDTDMLDEIWDAISNAEKSLLTVNKNGRPSAT